VTDVEFFFDPSCPWTWVTSRWLATVAPHRALAVTWRPWSLAMKNEGKPLPDSLPESIRQRIAAAFVFSTGALRVLEATGSRHGSEAVGRLYAELGRRVHGEGGRMEPAVIDEALAAAGLPAELGQAVDDSSWDEAIRATMAEVAGDIGDDVGVPIVALVDNGGRVAMAGPILAEVPPLERSLAMWDAVTTLVAEPAVYELKRHRAGGGPHPPRLDPEGRAEVS
jgi:hypothetical protein